MKKYIVLLCSILCLNTNAQTLKDSLLNINLDYYLNKPIDSLLAVLPPSYDSIYTGAGSSFFVGATVIVSYEDFTVKIFPSTHSYFNPLNHPYQPANIAWPLHLVRKELMFSVVITSYFPSDPWPLKEVSL